MLQSAILLIGCNIGGDSDLILLLLLRFLLFLDGHLAHPLTAALTEELVVLGQWFAKAAGADELGCEQVVTVEGNLVVEVRYHLHEKEIQYYSGCTTTETATRKLHDDYHWLMEVTVATHITIAS